MSALDETEIAGAEPQPRREKRKVSELWNRFRGWALQRGDGPVPTNPSWSEIEKAVELAKAGKFQELIFDSVEFKAEFSKYFAGDFDKLFFLAMDYHAGRVAYFVVNGWGKSPIEVMANGDIREGQHRLMAAMFMKLEEVEVLIF